MLGQVRDLVEDESNPLPLNLQGHSITPLHQSFRNYQAEVKTIDEETSVLVLSSPKHASGYRFEIDTQKRVITKQETLIEGKVTSVVLYEDFITTLNRWWPTKVTTTHAQRPDNPNYVVTQKIRKLSSNDFKLQWNKQLEKQKDSLTLSHPLPKLEVARKAVREGDANLAEHLVVMMRYCHFGVWKEAFEQLRSMESLASDKPGMQYIRIALELAAGRKEDARQKIVKRINTFVDGTVPGNPAPQRGDLFLATHLLSSVYPIISWTEYAPVVEKIKPIYDRQSDAAVAQLDWENRWVQVLNALKKHEEKLAFQEGMRQKYFGNVSVQIGYGSTLIELHRREEAKKFFLQQIGLEDHWRHHELTRLRDRYAEMLESNSEYDRDRDNRFVVGFSLPLPLFDRNQGNITEAEHMISKAASERREAEVVVATQLAQNRELTLAAYEEVMALRKEILPLTGTTLSKTQIGYEQGKFSYLNVLDAQRTLFEARSNYLDALRRYHVAAVTIQRLTGRALQDWRHVDEDMGEENAKQQQEPAIKAATEEDEK